MAVVSGGFVSLPARAAMKLALVVIALVSLLTVGLAFQGSVEEENAPLLDIGRWVSPRGGEEIPDFTGRWTLLTFFLPTCGSCAEEAPKLARLRENYAGPDFVMAGVTVGGVDPARTFMRKHGMTWPVMTDAGSNFEAYGVERVPDCFLVSPEGQIVARGREAAERKLAALFDGAIPDDELTDVERDLAQDGQSVREAREARGGAELEDTSSHDLPLVTVWPDDRAN